MAVGALPQGAAFDRACTRHDWLLLNGRYHSDASGHPTYFHSGGHSVLDLAIVSMGARADMQALSVRDTTVYHAAILTSLLASVPCSTPSHPTASCHPAAIQLTDQ